MYAYFRNAYSISGDIKEVEGFFNRQASICLKPKKKIKAISVFIFAAISF